MQILRVGLTGAGGTGKGTLLNGFMANYGAFRGFAPVRSPVQFVKGFVSPYSVAYDAIVKEDKMLLQYGGLFGEMNAERVLDDCRASCIAERSVLDFLPYFKQAFPPNESIGQVYTVEFYEKLIQTFLREMPYDLLVYVPIEFEPTQEDRQKNYWKERDPEKRKKTDDCILDQLAWVRDNTDITIISVSGTQDERVRQLVDVVESMQLGLSGGSAAPETLPMAGNRLEV